MRLLLLLWTATGTQTETVLNALLFVRWINEYFRFHHLSIRTKKFSFHFDTNKKLHYLKSIGKRADKENRKMENEKVSLLR